MIEKEEESLFLDIKKQQKEIMNYLQNIKRERVKQKLIIKIKTPRRKKIKMEKEKLQKDIKFLEKDEEENKKKMEKKYLNVQLIIIYLSIIS